MKTSNLLRLKENIDISYRALEKYVKISNVVLHKLANGTRAFKEHHIAKLTAFFDCTSDFLINKSNVGIYVYLKHPIAGIDRVLITDAQYAKLALDIETKIIKIYKSPTTINIFGQDIELPEYAVYRELKRDFSDIDTELLKPTVISLLNELNDDQLKKVLEMIKLVI